MVSLIERLYILEYLSGEVEFITRGLYWTSTKWEEQGIKNSSVVHHENTYLSFDLSFHKTDKFTKKWQNGEHAWLNLKTGEAKTF